MSSFEFSLILLVSPELCLAMHAPPTQIGV
jgi:hypothetical protein